MSELATAADILGRNKRRYTEVGIDGMKVRLRSINAAEYSAVASKLAEAGARGKGSTAATRSAAMATGHAMLLSMTVCNADGDRLFGDGEIEAIKGLDSQTWQSLLTASLEHCGFGEDDPEAAAKNSGETTAADSP